MTAGYSLQNFDAKTMVKVAGRNMPVSHKHCYEIANFIKGRQVDAAIKLLEDVVIQKRAVPYKRYTADLVHKPGKVGPGRYPRLASLQLIALLKNLRGQAQDKGFDTTKLHIFHAASQKGQKLRHSGRKGGTFRKNTNFELAAKEIEAKKTEKKEAKKT